MASPADISTNIKAYTYAELLIVLDLSDYDATNVDIIKKTSNTYIERFVKEGNKKMEDFFRKIQKVLIKHANEINSGTQTDTAGDKKVEEWVQDAGGLPQKNKVQSDKITNRFQKIDLFDNKHLPMERQHVGVNNTYNVDIAQDGKLNPTLKNITTRMVALDSFFRQEAADFSISTDYTLDLSDRLSNVLSMRLFSVQIPMTYYVIDDVYGNTCFWITHDTYNIPISISPGNYKPSEFEAALNAAFGDAGFTFVAPPVSYSTNTYKVTLRLDGGVFTPPVGSSVPPFTINAFTAKITFFNLTKALVCKQTCLPQAFHINETLGWLMGFHNKTGVYDVQPEGNVADAIIDLSGPRYFLLVLDDYVQNHINNGIITITEPSKLVDLPTYYATDHPYICVDDNGANVQQFVQNAPRTLTQNQLYTINEILKNNVNNVDIRAKAPTTPNVFAIIPLKQQEKGTMYIDFSGQLQENKRVYFGPVDIERMRVKLVTDKGHVVNLNGGDWSFIMLCETLYQY